MPAFVQVGFTGAAGSSSTGRNGPTFPTPPGFLGPAGNFGDGTNPGIGPDVGAAPAILASYSASGRTDAAESVVDAVG